MHLYYLDEYRVLCYLGNTLPLLKVLILTAGFTSSHRCKNRETNWLSFFESDYDILTGNSLDNDSLFINCFPPSVFIENVLDFNCIHRHSCVGS